MKFQFCFAFNFKINICMWIFCAVKMFDAPVNILHMFLSCELVAASAQQHSSQHLPCFVWDLCHSSYYPFVVYVALLCHCCCCSCHYLKYSFKKRSKWQKCICLISIAWHDNDTYHDSSVCYTFYYSSFFSFFLHKNLSESRCKNMHTFEAL